MKSRPKKHYVNNKDFFEALVAYREKKAIKPDVRPSNYIGECILQINKNLATKGNFSGYTYRDEMVDDGVENCVKAIDGFDPEKTANPFAYFSQIAWNAFIRRIDSEHKEQYIKHKNMQQMFIFASDEDRAIQPADAGDLSNRVIEAFEAKLLKNKNKSKLSGTKKIPEGE